jgi:4'-phosphopantetheinyl transferase
MHFQPLGTLPDRLDLPGDALHLWHLPLAAPAEQVVRAARHLAPDEIARADRFHFDRNRTAFILARSNLRAILAAYIGTAPDAVAFRFGDKGKPFLDGPGPQFNLSHSAAQGLIAVAPVPVGVDVECIRTVRDARAIAERFFSPAERTALATIPDSGLDEAFFTAWTRKEAFIKWSGDGLSMSLDGFDVSLRPGEPARILAVGGDPRQGEAWSLFDLRPAPGIVGAVVLPRGDWLVSAWCADFRF